MSVIRVRIAPSPTGSIHVGLARTALSNALFARQQSGALVLRIEDTDEQRNVASSEQQIYEGLAWLGLQWDEGPDKGGQFGPYRQSERTALYRTHMERLLADGALYWCYCTPEELAAERAAQTKAGQPPIYSGKCRNASAGQLDTWKHEGRHPILRFATQPEAVTFDDLVRGTVTFRTESIGDFSVAKDLDRPLYNFAVVVDDALMQISHVIRGEEHLSNTPKQLLLFRALGFRPPVYGHLPLLLGPNRKKLSKRDAVTSVADYRKQGYLSEALLNFLALLGWHPKDAREVFTFDELLSVFRIEDVQKAGAIFDQKKLDDLNSRYIRTLTTDSLIERAGEWLEPLASRLGNRLRSAVALAQERLTTLAGLPEALGFFVQPDPYEPLLLVPPGATPEDTAAVLNKVREFFGSLDDFPEDAKSLHDQTTAWIAKQGLTNGAVLWPLRVSLTGRKHSPGVFDIAAILGKDEVLGRVAEAIQRLAAVAKRG